MFVQLQFHVSFRLIDVLVNSLSYSFRFSVCFDIHFTNFRQFNTRKKVKDDAISRINFKIMLKKISFYCHDELFVLLFSWFTWVSERLSGIIIMSFSRSYTSFSFRLWTKYALSVLIWNLAISLPEWLIFYVFSNLFNYSCLISSLNGTPTRDYGQFLVFVLIWFSWAPAGVATHYMLESNHFWANKAPLHSCLTDF